MIKDEMAHPDKKPARNIDMPGRCRTFTDIVYSGEGDPGKLYAALDKAQHMFEHPNIKTLSANCTATRIFQTEIPR